jgi:hypothetical protein
MSLDLRRSCVWALLTFALLCGAASAQTQIKGRALVMIDTSGSMVWHFGDCATTGGDSGSPSLLCDNNIGTSFACSLGNACTIANGALPLFASTPSNPSRLFAAKQALANVINSSSGSIDYGLERYALASLVDGYNPNPCPNGTYCCTPPGHCGACTADSQCCAPLRCVGGTCQFSTF